MLFKNMWVREIGEIRCGVSHSSYSVYIDKLK